MIDKHAPAQDPIEAAVATLVRRGGQVKIATDRIGPAGSLMELTVSYRRSGDGRIGLDGSVSGLVGQHGLDLGRLGWATQSVDDTELPYGGWLAGLDAEQRASIEASETRRQAGGPDYRREFFRAWELPPMTLGGVAEGLRATISILDGRPPASTHYKVRVGGPLDGQLSGLEGCLAGPLSLLVGGLIAGFVVIIPRELGQDVVYHAGIAGVAVLLVVWILGPSLIQRLPGARDWGVVAYLVALLALPAVAIVAWALFGF